MILQNPDNPADIVRSESMEGYEGWAVLPDDAVDASILEARKAELLTKVKGTRERKKEAGTAVTGVGVVKTDLESRINVNGLVAMAQLDPVGFAVDFSRKDGERIPLNAATMIALGVKVGRHVKACHDTCSTHEELIKAAQSLADLEALDVTEGWP